MSAIDASAILASISTLENELNRLKASLGGDSMPVKPTAKAPKKAKDPNAEKKEPNVWIKFTLRVEAILAAAKAAAGTDEAALAPFKGPATIAKQFASFLKDTKAYGEWTDEEILGQFRTWTRPEQSKMAAAGKTKSAKTSPAASVAGSGDEAASVTSAEPKQRKKPAPKTPEEQAAINAKRAATKAAKAAATATAPAGLSAAEVKDSWVPIEGTEYGVNCRGEVADEDGNFIGKRGADGAIDKTAAQPADWAQVTP
jgi:hypothetical protein